MSHPGSAWTLVVRYFGSRAPSILDGGTLRDSGHWSRLGSRVPLPVQVSHPMLQPCENQKHPCPLRQGSADAMADSVNANNVV